MQINTNNNHLAFKGQLTQTGARKLETNFIQDMNHLKNLAKKIKPENINANHSYFKLVENGDMTIRVTLKNGASIKLTPTESTYTFKEKEHFIKIPQINTRCPFMATNKDKLLLAQEFLSLKIKLTNYLLKMLK